MMRRLRFALLLTPALAPLRVSAQATPVDTSVTVRGIVRSQHEGAGRWGLFLPAPVVVRSVPLNWVSIDSQSPGVANYEDKFVQVTGTLRGGAVLVNPQIKERDPEGMVRRQVQLSYTQRAVVTLAVAPTRFARTDTTSHASESGARPLVLFELTNQSDTPLHLEFPNSEVLCVRAQMRQGSTVVDTAWAIVRPGVKKTSIIMGQRYRMIFELPAGATPLPGTYSLQAGLCPAPEYGALVKFEVGN